MSLIPEGEIGILINTADLAARYAGEGDAEAGYLELLYGLNRARAFVGEPWTEELIGRYRDALRRFARLHLPRNGAAK